MSAKIALGLSELSPAESVSSTVDRITSLNTNAGTFPQPNPSVPVLTQAKNNLDTRLKAIAQMEGNFEAERAPTVTAEAELDANLEQTASYVEIVAKG